MNARTFTAIALVTVAGSAIVWASQPAGVALAQPVVNSAAATANASAAESAAPAVATPAVAKTGIALAAYAWPKTASPAPKEDEWLQATRLETVHPKTTRGWRGGLDVTCEQLVVREWMRVTCTPPHPVAGEDTLLGVVWGMAGDLGSAKATFTLASTLSRYKAPPTDQSSDLWRKMGASASVTFQALPGSALLLSLDRIGIESQYDGGEIVFSQSGILIDVSWAEGEKEPTVLYR